MKAFSAMRSTFYGLASDTPIEFVFERDIPTIGFRGISSSSVWRVFRQAPHNSREDARTLPLPISKLNGLPPFQRKNIDGEKEIGKEVGKETGKEGDQSQANDRCKVCRKYEDASKEGRTDWGGA
jgi:hypothetical protein